VTLPFVIALAEQGAEAAMLADRHLRDGLNVYRGQVTCKGVADGLGKPYMPPEEAVKR